MPFTEYGVALRVDPSQALFYSSLTLLILITGFFTVPVAILAYVQSGNFLNAKSTMERFSRQTGGSYDDQTQRILNSGIKDDTRIIYDTNLTSGSFS